MPLTICEDDAKLRASLPSDYGRLDIRGLTNITNITRKYVQARIKVKFNLHTFRQNIIKLSLQSLNEKVTNLYAFGRIAKELNDFCSVGDTLVMTNFEVDPSPKTKEDAARFQIILDDNLPFKPSVWMVKAPGDQDGDGQNPQSSAPPVPSTQPSTSGKAPSRTKESPTKKPCYTYALLKDIVIRTTVHVYGVVTYKKPVQSTQGEDHHMMLSIADPSLGDRDQPLVCNLFHKDQSKLPGQVQVGDVIRFHRLKVVTFQGKKQGRDGPGFHWVVFQSSFDERMASSDNYTLAGSDKDKFGELLTWWGEVSSLYSQGTNEVMLSCDAQADAAGPSCSPKPSTSREPDTSLSSSSESFLEKLSPLKAPPLVYQTLSELREQTVTSFYAVVVYARAPVFTTRSEYHLMMNVCDPSLGHRDAKVTCNLFDADCTNLPVQSKAGDVIRLDRIKIVSYNKKKQAIRNQRLQWVLFQQSFDTRVLSSPNCPVNEDERQKVQSLLNWWKEGPDATPFSQVVIRQYFCCICQVVGLCLVEDSGYCLLRVWDGSEFKGPILKKVVEGMPHDVTLAKAAGDLTHDVFVFDNHIAATKDFEPGDYIQLNNLHAALVSGRVEMTLHGGTSFQRGVRKLDPSHSGVAKLKALLDPMVSRVVGTSSPRQNESKDKNNPRDGVSVNPIPSTLHSAEEGDKNSHASVGARGADNEAGLSKQLRTQSAEEKEASGQESVALLENLPSTSSGHQGLLQIQNDQAKKTDYPEKDGSGSKCVSGSNAKTHVVDVIVLSDTDSSLSELSYSKEKNKSNNNDVITEGSSSLFGHGPNNSADFRQEQSVVEKLTLSESELQLSGRDRVLVPAALAAHQENAMLKSVRDGEINCKEDESLSGNDKLMADSLQLSSVWSGDIGLSMLSHSGTMGFKDSSLSESVPRPQAVKRRSEEELGKSKESCTTQGMMESSQREVAKLVQGELSTRRSSRIKKETEVLQAWRMARKQKEKQSISSSNTSTSSISDEGASASGVCTGRVLRKRLRPKESDMPRTKIAHHHDDKTTSSTSSRLKFSEAAATAPPGELVTEGPSLMSRYELRSERWKNAKASSSQSSDEDKKKVKANEDDLKTRNQKRVSEETHTGTNQMRFGNISNPLPTTSPQILKEGEGEEEVLASSQDTFYTAVQPPSPTYSLRSNVQTSPAFLSSLPTSPQKRYLSLRVTSPTAVTAESPTRGESPTPCAVNTRGPVSSSVGDVQVVEGSAQSAPDSSNPALSLPPDRQPSDGSSAEITSSSDILTPQSGQSGISSSATSTRGQLLTICPRSLHRQTIKLETFDLCHQGVKGKVRARLLNYFPRTGNSLDLVQFCCFACNYVVSPSEVRVRRIQPCPNGCGALEQHILMKMVLSDGEYELMAVLWGRRANEFFCNVTAEDLLHKPTARAQVQGWLDRLCPPQATFESRPLLEFSLYSYVFKNCLQFQIFDTVIDDTAMEQLVIVS